MAETTAAPQALESVRTLCSFPVLYLGSMPMDRLYSQTMQPWVMAEIRRKREGIKEVTVEVLRDVLQIFNTNQGQNVLLLEHHVKGITRFAKLHQDPLCFAYLTRYQLNADFECHVFLANSEEIIPKIFKAIRDATKDVSAPRPTVSLPAAGGSQPQSGFDWEGGEQSRSLFEVKYMGRAKVASKRVTAEYIDCLAEKMIAREEDQLMKTLEERERTVKQQEEEERKSCGHASDTSSLSYPDSSDFEVFIDDQLSQQKLAQRQTSLDGSSAGKPDMKGDLDNVFSASISLSTPVFKSSNDMKFSLASSASGSDSSREALDSSSEYPLPTAPLNLSPRLLHTTSVVSDPLGAIATAPDSGEATKLDLRTAMSNSTAKADSLRRRHSSHREEGNLYYVSERFRRASGDSADSICSLYEPSRVMVLQISHQDLSLISLDKKGAILQCKFKDISSLSQGKVKQDIFGIVARDGSLFICYMLKCLSDSVVSEIMGTLKTAFTAAYSKKTAVATCTNDVVNSPAPSTTQVCTMCPLHQLHRISQEISNMSPQAGYDYVIKKLKNLADKDYNDIIQQLEAESPDTLEESVEVLMIGLRQLCERKQKEHTHISSESHKQASTEINLLEEKTNLFQDFRSKARKSLTTSFETLLRGKKKEDAKDGMRQRSWTTDSEASWASKDSSAPSTPDISPMPSPMSKEFQHDFPSPPTSPGPIRKRSATLDSLGSFSRPEPPGGVGRRRDVNHNRTNSPLKTSFLLATNTPQHSESLSPSLVNSPMDDHSLLASSRRPSSSWRKAIFDRVCTPQHSLEFGDSIDGKLHNTVEIRAMWKKAILETLLLIRMEKENHDIRARQEEGGGNVCRKLDYQELTPCLKEITSVWEQMLALHEVVEGSEPGDDGKTIPQIKLLDYVKKGVPRSLRGQIWLFLMQQRQMSSAVPDSTCEAADYDDLLKQLTTHQHAILIDLGRTFPCHPYFAKALGPGQLELFNLLKAYSLLDPEVGYCQGLSFIVGMLLMHMEEISAFHVLKYMMYHLGLRKQFRPNMTALQIKLYQLTRLLHDHYRDVYDHFENHEISPTLYAAPWFLTLFASQFPLGFVARVFDMIFVQGIDCLFKVALMLIGNHRALILQCDSFESVVDFLKTTLPEMVQVQMERIINQAFEMDITKELQAYEVEYHVLSEEMTYSPHDSIHYGHQNRHYHTKTHSPPAGSERSSRLIDRRRSSIDIEMMYCMEQQNRQLKNQNMDLLEKLQHAQSQQRSTEHSVHVHQIETEKLKSHIRTLELERGALLQAVAKLKKIIPREALLQLNLALPPMPDSSSNSPPPPPKPVLVSESIQVSEKDFSLDLLDLSGTSEISSSQSDSSILSDLTKTNSQPVSLNCLAASQEDSQTLAPISPSSHIDDPTESQLKPVSPVHVSPSAGGDPCRTVSRPPPRITLPMPHLQLSGVSTSEGYPSRSISNVSGSAPSLPPEERRKSVKVVVQQSPTNCHENFNSSR